MSPNGTGTVMSAHQFQKMTTKTPDRYTGMEIKIQRV